MQTYLEYLESVGEGTDADMETERSVLNAITFDQEAYDEMVRDDLKTT